MALLDIEIGSEPNDGLGDDLRNGAQKINQNFFNVENYTGGASYFDETYEIGSPLVIEEGVRTKLTCDNGTIVDGNLPFDFSGGMWNATTNKLVAINEKDRIILEIRFKASASVNNAFFDVEIDIGGTLNVISAQTNLFSKLAGVEQSFNTLFVYFTGATFIDNGGDIFINPINGNLNIYDINLVITRIHKGR